MGYGFAILAFIFGVLGSVALTLAYLKIKKIKKEYKKIQESSKELEEKQNQLLSNMSEHIYKMVKQAVGSTSAIASKMGENELNKELCDVIQTENQLLDIANDLIEFLHLKSKKVKISYKKYKLDNLFNDLTGFISKNFHAKPIELTYQVDKNIPHELIGDTLKISKVLYNLLDYSIRNGATNLLLHTSKAPGFQSENELIFLIKTNLSIDIENETFLFKTKYDESSNSYESLGLFVAKELASLMQGELIARNDKEGRVEFLFSMVFQYPDETPSKTIDPKLLHKTIAIIDKNTLYANALKGMFETLENHVTLVSPEELLHHPKELKKYDIIALDEKLFSASVVKALQNLKKEHEIQVIALSNFFNPIDEQYYTKIADHKLLKPTTRGTLLHLIEKIYLPKEEQKTDKEQICRTPQLQCHQKTFANTPNVSIDTFALFQGLRLMIVEDDVINQKVLQGVLKRSEMLIDIANNGEECLELLKQNKHYDMILMDINMPVMDGYAATRKIRESSAYDTIPIIALTALTSPDEVSKMFDVGMNGHLAKPLHKEKLFTAFDMFLQQTSEPLEIPEMQEKKEVSYNGLDVAKGIARANNNEEFYKEILQEFLTTYHESAKLYEKLIHDFRYEQVRMLCLDMKGLSALIGASELHTLMLEIHQQLIFKKFDMLGGYTKTFYEKIDMLNHSIEEYIQS
jgi:CheY-like chemotaxis protein